MENVEELIGIISDKEINTEEKNCCGELIKKLLYCAVIYGVVGTWKGGRSKKAGMEQASFY